MNDGYDGYYADRLWQRLPFGVPRSRQRPSRESGPLGELIARIGAQIAVVRRSIDRLWANQSIETCDDWVIPYLGDLLATELVNEDPRGQRLEVAKTIHYRRRKGTLAVLEEIGRDVTGWQAHVVEAFRRLGRTRHALDPVARAGGTAETSSADDGAAHDPARGADGPTDRYARRRTGRPPLSARRPAHDSAVDE